jgi:molybdate transport system substrate-binding protein
MKKNYFGVQTFRFALFALAVIVLLASCATTPVSPTPPPVTLTIFAAASLTDAFNEIGHNFEAKHPEIKVVFNFAGSQQLAQQLTEGAPADIFASASRKQIDALSQENGRIISGTAHIFARNRLVVIYSHHKKLQQLADLTQSGLKIVLAAKEVPVGQYALDFLEKAAQDKILGAAFKAGVLKNVVSYEENVRSVLTKVTLGEGDAGIVYTSDISGEAAQKVGQIAIPDPLNTIATYPIAPIHDSPAPQQAATFINYVLSAEGQAVLIKYGFISID